MKQVKLTAIFMAFIAALLLGACSDQEEVTLNAEQEKAMSERLAPDGEVAMAGEASGAASGGSGGSRSGQEIYDSKCTTCHTSGAAGAPILGKAEDWTDRIGKGRLHGRQQQIERQIPVS
jgi:cytochrome c5